MTFYDLSWDLFEKMTCPSDPSVPCEVSPSENIRPCRECLHCHDHAQEIENLLEAAYAAGKAGTPKSEVPNWWKTHR